MGAVNFHRLPDGKQRPAVFYDGCVLSCHSLSASAG
jgi:hypothetical protein